MNSRPVRTLRANRRAMRVQRQIHRRGFWTIQTNDGSGWKNGSVKYGNQAVALKDFARFKGGPVQARVAFYQGRVPAATRKAYTRPVFS